MDCRTIPAVNFKTKLLFNQHDPIMTQEQSILSKIKSVFSVEEIILQHNVLSYRIDAYFPKYKLAIEVHEKNHNDRDIDYEIRRQKALEKELDCEFIRINPAIKKFETGKIQNHIINSTEKMTKKSTKESVTSELSNKLLGLKFKANNSIKTKCLKDVVKKILPEL